MTDTSKQVELTGSFAAGLLRIGQGFKRRFLTLGFLLRLALFLGLVPLYIFFVKDASGGIPVILFISVFFVFFVSLIFSPSRAGTHFKRMRTLLEWLRLCQGDTHSASRLLGFVDKVPVASGTPRRKVRSPGGKMKHYYRRRVASLRFALADGNLLALELIGRAKTKAGQVINEDYEVRGRLKLNALRYRLPAQEWASAGFQVRALQRAGQDHLCFWGNLSVPRRGRVASGPEGVDLGLFAPLDRALADIYRRLRRV